jgi:hypothetical protein
VGLLTTLAPTKEEELNEAIRFALALK